jgi:hypothetical protein
MVPQLVMKEHPYLYNSTEPPGARQVRRRGSQRLSRKASAGQEPFAPKKRAEPLDGLRPMKSNSLTDTYSQVTRSAGRI